jgi:hypothetical protein
MSCPRREEILDAANGAGDAVRDHVASCAACRAAYDGFMAATEVLASTPFSEKTGPCLSDSQIIAFARRRLPVEPREAVEEHLAACPKCRDGAVDLVEALGASGEDAPAALEDRILGLGPQTASGVRRSVTARIRPAGGARRPSALLWATAAAVLFAVVVVLALPKGRTPAVQLVKPPVPKREAVAKEEPPRPEPPKPVVREEPKPEPPKPPPAPKPEEPRLVVEPRRETPKPVEVPKPAPPEPPKPLVREEPKPEPKTEVKTPKFLPVRVLAVNGPVSRRNGGALARGAVLEKGDELFTDARHLASLALEGGVSVFLEAGSAFSVEQVDGGETRLTLKSGPAFFRVEKRTQPFVVATPSADAVVVGTGFQLDLDERRSVLHVLEGTIRFRNEKGEVLVGANQRSLARRGEKPGAPVRVDVAPLAAWTERPDLQGAPLARPWMEHAAGRNRKLAGLVVASPYFRRETESGRLAQLLAESLDVGLALGHNHRDRAAEKRVWLNVDRWTEVELRPDGTQAPARETERAKQATIEWLGHLRSAAGLPAKAPVPMVAVFRTHSETVGGQDLESAELAWTGWNRRTIEQAKAHYAALLDKHQPSFRLDLRFEGVDDVYDVRGTKRKFLFTEGDAEATGYMAPQHSQNALAIFFPLSFGRHADDFDAYSKIFAELLEWLYQRKR